MNNLVDMLLATDLETLKRPHIQKEVTRLSTALGEPFILELEALTIDEFTEIQEMSFDSKSGSVDTNKVKAYAIIKSCSNMNFADSALREKFSALSDREVVTKLLLPGEMATIYNSIAEISGFGKDAVTTVKNA